LTPQQSTRQIRPIKIPAIETPKIPMQENNRIGKLVLAFIAQ
jgi:hypothetical protein